MFSDPNALTVQLSDLDGAIVAMRKIKDGRTVTRTLEDGTTVSGQPVLTEVLVYNGETAQSETTLVFPKSLQETIEGASGYVVGRLAKEDHPSKPGWQLWQLNPIEGETKEQAVAAFEAIV